MPNKNTFDIPPIKRLLNAEVDTISERWIDPFANKNKMANITNDINTTYDTDYHLDDLEFLKKFPDNSVDGVLYDPPYSPRQIKECYDNIGCSVPKDSTKSSFWSNQKKKYLVL